MPGRGTSRQPAGVRSTARSTSRAALRPIRSAPAPRAGSSGRWAKPGSSPTTSRIASAGSVPGRDPTPEAGPHVGGTGLGSSLLSGSDGEITTATLVRRRDPSGVGQPILVVWLAGGGETGEYASKYAT